MEQLQYVRLNQNSGKKCPCCGSYGFGLADSFDLIFQLTGGGAAQGFHKNMSVHEVAFLLRLLADRLQEGAEIRQQPNAK